MSKKARHRRAGTPTPSLKRMLRENRARYGDNPPTDPFAEESGADEGLMMIDHTDYGRFRGEWPRSTYRTSDPEPPEQSAREHRPVAPPSSAPARPTSARGRKAQRNAANAAARGKRTKPKAKN